MYQRYFHFMLQKDIADRIREFELGMGEKKNLREEKEKNYFQKRQQLDHVIRRLFLILWGWRVSKI